MNSIFYIMFNLIFYSFIGWIIEEVYCYTITKEFQKDGFLIGPFKPMYGIAFTLLILCKEMLIIDGIPLILLCFLIPTTVEYISGYVLKHTFNKVYWDYSNFRCNIHGFVTLKFSIYWMILSLVGLYYLQTIVYSLYIQEQDFFNVLLIAGVIILAIDCYFTMKRLAYEKFKVV
ncbi:putative ABC transporter permease [Clostridium chromiireducens]|uniref:putative ABC transporter permease n=1 Tax=Clostridium chromiireducens TaxID=225345 RepID=UPI003AF6B856